MRATNDDGRENGEQDRVRLRSGVYRSGDRAARGAIVTAVGIMVLAQRLAADEGSRPDRRRYRKGHRRSHGDRHASISTGGHSKARVAPFVLHGKEKTGEPVFFKASSIQIGLKIVSLLRKDLYLQSLSSISRG